MRRPSSSDAQPEPQRRLLSLRVLALAFWIACVIVLLVPRPNGGTSAHQQTRFRQPAEPIPRILRHEQ